MSTLTLGIDVSKDKLDVALYQDGTYLVATFSNNKDGFRRLAKWLKKRQGKGAHVCIEATGQYGEAVAMFLHERGYPVSVVNPARIKAYAESQLRRNKSDRQDARVIAHFCATQEPSLWAPPPPEVQELRALCRRLEALKADRTRELNRRQSGLTSPAVLATIDEHIAFLDNQIAAIEQRIKELIDRHPDLRQQHDLLTSIPGIGDLTAANFLAEVPDLSRFDSAGQLAAYAGLTPYQHHSGSSVHRPGRLVKTGSIRFRTALYMPALTAMQFNPIVVSLVKRLEARGKKRMTIVGAVMRKLVHLAYGVLKHRKPFDPDYLVNVQVTA
jgi:transposase